MLNAKPVPGRGSFNVATTDNSSGHDYVPVTAAAIAKIRESDAQLKAKFDAQFGPDSYRRGEITLQRQYTIGCGAGVFESKPPMEKLSILLVDRWLECLPGGRLPYEAELFHDLQRLQRFEDSGAEGNPGNPDTVVGWLFLIFHLVDADCCPDGFRPAPVDVEAAGIVREAMAWASMNPGATFEDPLAAPHSAAPRRKSQAPGPQIVEMPAPPDMSLRVFQITDTGNAERLVNRHGADIRFCHHQKVWYVFDGMRWAPDQRGWMMHLAKGIARALHAEASEILDDDRRKKYAAWALKSESTDRKKAALISAQSEGGVPIMPADFDTDRFLLNCVNGTVDLRTGELRPHRREDLMTKLCPVKYDAAARSELWDRFLNETTEGNRDLQGFLQRAVGYSLTGDVSEEVLFFVHGPGASGKSTFLESIKTVLGDYAKTADFETFVQKTAGGIRDDVAELSGRRFVLSVEVDDGKRLAQGLTKLLTGGDTVRARQLYQQAFEFQPQFKLWLGANHAPKVDHADDALWRRILRIPFDHAVPRDKRDPTIKKRLKDVNESGPAILAWAVEGCLRWRDEGLGVPPVVEAATAQYRMDQDPLRDFLADCCVLRPTSWVLAADLRRGYEVYCKANGDKQPLGPHEFAAGLLARGCTRMRRHAGHSWQGVGILADSDESDET